MARKTTKHRRLLPALLAAAALAATLTALVSPGEEVIVPAPYFPEYKVFIERTGAKILPVPTATDPGELTRQLEELRIRVLQEQNHLTGVIGTWSGFLTSTGDNAEILRSAANLALQLDQVRDTALEIEHLAETTGDTRAWLTELSRYITICNEHHATLINELKVRRRGNAA